MAWVLIAPFEDENLRREKAGKEKVEKLFAYRQTKHETLVLGKHGCGMNIDQIFSISALAQIVFNPYENRMISANLEACKFLSLSIEEITQARPSDFFPECGAQLIIFTDEVIAHGSGWCDRLRITKNNIPVEITGRHYVLGSEYVIVFAMQYAEEIDKQRKASDAERHYQSGIGHWNRVAHVFREFERENHLLLEAAGEGIYGVDANGDTTFVNPAAQRILGYEADELAGKNMHTMVHHTHVDGEEFHSEHCPIYAAFAQGTVQTVEDDVFWHKSGKPISVEYTSTPIVENGVIMGAVVVFRDITQKKEDKKKLLEALEQVKELTHRLELENAYLQEEINSEFNHHHIIGNSPAVQTILQQISMVAPTEATVLIHGESGTGKELIARAIHEESQRSKRSLIRVNCAAIPEDLFESEFFGHIKGAFTGATQDRAGRFELANGGTLFLDEVGEIPLHLQSKLLRVLQEQQFERIGDAKTQSVDVRIIAATNQNLRALVDEGRFREDLFFRLNVFPIHSAPLRQRTEDIPLLTQHFLEKSCARSGKKTLKVSMADIQKLQSYSWPGNIRELENVIERQVILSSGESFSLEGFNVGGKKQPQLPPSNDSDGEIKTIIEIQDIERSNIVKALKRCEGKIFGKEGAAELLCMKPTTLSSRLLKLNIEASKFKRKIG